MKKCYESRISRKSGDCKIVRRKGKIYIIGNKKLNNENIHN
jgi:ribosomal protein L36